VQSVVDRMMGYVYWQKCLLGVSLFR